MIPALETERLLLRGHRADDFDDCAAMWADADVTRHIGGRPFTREAVWARICRYVGHWALVGYGYWIVRERSGRFVGEVGFADFRRDDVDVGGAPEIGWALATAAHGRGFATEAVRAVVAWGEATWGSRRTVCLIDPANVKSIRVAEKCGYVEERRATYHGEPTVVFARG